jgi:polyisoprenoid-binding protein YceI
MVTTDLTGDQNTALVGHLSSTGFFDTATHPTALFTLISSTPNTASGANMYTIVGDLALKGVSKQITFPATVTVS